MASQGFPGQQQQGFGGQQFGGQQGFAAGGQQQGWGAGQQQGWGAGGQQFGGQQGFGGGQQGWGQQGGFGGQQQGFGGQQGFGAGQQQQRLGGQQSFGGQQGWGGQQQGLVGNGFGNRQLAPAEIQMQLRGKPAFFDSNRGILWDGQQAWCYVAPNALQQHSNVITAIETTPTGTIIRIGNGTQGDLREHASALASAYALECQPRFIA